MRFLFRLLCLLLAMSGFLPAQTAASAPTVTVRWYGQGFIYLITSTGIRVAIDPFMKDSVDYVFPNRLQADVVLITNESDESSGGEQLFGTPQIFRCITAIGMNKARGLLFKGTETFLDNQKGNQLGENTSFTFNLDGVQFGHLGEIGHSLNSEQRHDLKSVDVLFLPVGNPAVSVADLKKMCVDLQAKIIVPICYATVYNSKMNLRKLDDFLQGATNFHQLDSNEFTVSTATLPVVPTILIPKIAEQK